MRFEFKVGVGVGFSIGVRCGVGVGFRVRVGVLAGCGFRFGIWDGVRLGFKWVGFMLGIRGGVSVLWVLGYS